jgi:hypothetical protein
MRIKGGDSIWDIRVLWDIQPTGDTWASMMGLSWGYKKKYGDTTNQLQGLPFFPNVWG